MTPAGLARALAGGPVFVLLDGCEQVVDAVADVAGELLRLTDTVSILATSREPLGLSNESIFRLPSFAVPATAAELHTAGVRFPAIDLFIERAGLAEPDARLTEEEVATIVGLCRRLDGVPLAIELAAAHLATFGLDVLRERLLEALAIPGPRDAPARQQTMLATIAWSFELLDPAEQRLLERLAIFHGGFTLDAMVVVCADGAQTRGDISSVLFRLIDKSLVEVIHGGSTTRYRLLELVRGYALERLSRSEEDQTVGHRHVHWMASAADALRNGPTCRDFSGANSDLENARAAVEFAFGVGTEDGCILAGRILLGFRPIWCAVGDFNEHIALAQRCLGRLDPRQTWQQTAELMHALAESETEACFASVAEVMLNVAPRPPLRLVE
jgi:predicted ATPase